MARQIARCAVLALCASALRPPVLNRRLARAPARSLTRRVASAEDEAPAPEAVEAAAAAAAVEDEAAAPAAEEEEAAPPPAPPARVANAKKDYADFNPDQPDIVQKFVKQRDDWWSTDSPFPGAPVDATSGAGPVAALAALPLPAYLWLLTATVLAIAFTGSCFQLFYNVPRAPVLGVPVTAAILAASGPGFVFLFLVAIARGQREADEDDAKNGF